MKSLEEQLNHLIAESDRVAADLGRELYLIGRADAAISYLRNVREQTAVQVAALLEQRSIGALTHRSGARHEHHKNGLNGFEKNGFDKEAFGQGDAFGQTDAFGTYDPNWPQ